MSTNLLRLINVRGSLIQLPKFSGVFMSELAEKYKIKTQSF